MNVSIAPPTQIDVLPVDLARSIAQFFQVLSDPTRVRIVKALAEGEWCVTDLVDALKMDQPAVSHQLKYLRKLGVVSYRKKGRHVYYMLDDDQLRDVLFSGIKYTID
jgi:ArsR family transcriptional regulator, lead/cadmium/zinc/bismuth-responsive transcriptional repressor